jgi:hypothetical protein
LFGNPIPPAAGTATVGRSATAAAAPLLGSRHAVRFEVDAERAASARTPIQHRRPAETVLYQLVQEHLETFLALSDDGTGEGQAPSTWNGIFASTSIAESWPEVLRGRAAKTAVTTT